MDERQAAAKGDETSPAHFEGPGIGQSTLNPERHPAIAEMEQQAKLVIDLCPRPPEEEKLVEILREENKLLKSRLKGFEALAYLYQQSKNECTSLKKLCMELSDEREQYRKKFSITDIELHNFPDFVEKNTFKATDPVGSLREETKLNSENSRSVGVQTLNLDDCNTAVAVQNEAFHLSENPSYEKPEGPFELKSREFKQALATGNRMADDESQSSFSLLEIQSSLASSDDGITNKNCEKSHDLARSSEVPANSHELFGSRELSAFYRHLMKPEASKESKGFLRELLSVGFKLISLEEQMQTEENLDRRTLFSEPHRLRQTESSATQTLDEEIPICYCDQSSDLQLAPKDANLTCSSSSEQRKSSIVTEDLITEVQILRQQVMTFKDDFERERQDREKVRAEYELLKWHFDRVSADFRDIKDQLRSAEIKLEESEREKTALRHKITKTANELRMLKKGPSPSRTEVIPQRVQPSDTQQTWPCIHCTYLNPHPRQTCEMCGRAAAHRFRPTLQAQ